MLKPYTRKVVRLRTNLQLIKLSKSGPQFVTYIFSLALLRSVIIIGQVLLLLRLITHTTLEGAITTLSALALTLAIQSLIAFMSERYSIRGGHSIQREIRQSLLARAAQDDQIATINQNPDEISSLLTDGISNLENFYQRSLSQLIRVILIPLIIVAMIVIGVLNADFASGFAIILILLILAPEIFLPIRALIRDSHLVNQSITTLQRVSTVLTTPSTTAAPDDTDEPAPSLGRVKEIRWTDGEVVHGEELSVTFRWGIASGGKLTVISGPAGSGKTTLLQSLIRIHRLNEGRIFIETSKGTYRIEELGVNQWLDQISWIPQDPYFVSGTIEENLKLIKPRANRQRLSDVLAEANLAVELLPNGLQTTIDQLDSTPTSGEVRRLALARALLKDAPIIFSDAPLEPIDSSHERQIQVKLKELAREGKLVITVSDDEEVLKMADRKIVLDSTRIEPMRILESAQ